MSEAYKKLKENNKRPLEPLEVRREKFRKRFDLTQKDIEELDRKTEEALKEEQRIKQAMKQEVMKVTSIMKADIGLAIADEERGVKEYERLATIYGNVGWRKIFSDLAREEREHVAKLKIALKVVDEEIKKYIIT